MKTNCVYFNSNQDIPLCSKKNIVLDTNKCLGCNYYRKKKSVLNSLKTYNKKPKQKRAIVSKETYEIVNNEAKGHCQLCGLAKPLVLHHIIFRSETKSLIDEPSNCIMICQDCHLLVHAHKLEYQSILQQIKKGNN